MTLLAFPDLPGIDVAVSKRPEIKTEVFTNPLSGRESRLRFQLYPKYIFKLSVNALFESSDAEFQVLMGFMVQIGGQASAFLYKDPFDSQIVDEVLGAGDGTRTDYPLQRTFGGFTEAVHNPDMADIAVSIDWVVQDAAAYTVTASGVVQFNIPPGNGAVVSWTGGYFYRVRLMADGYDFVRVATNVYECTDIEFVGSVRNLV
ncbi:MAG: DUF2460 domain-containing protein [Methylovulum sp.]|uniref:DUF2460 domain-containing protein n=1 Tax=Methylovulum sp. TaxID=1916980 RepID=UPI00260F9ADA|nr:DUF2460 domain-containing protein [Methylovulum sp.]MDD2725406.1 DUF2460 domain-containing protein [Methylovulum sp.]